VRTFSLTASTALPTARQRKVGKVGEIGVCLLIELISKDCPSSDGGDPGLEELEAVLLIDWKSMRWLLIWAYGECDAVI
jgi:hypothetical protein